METEHNSDYIEGYNAAARPSSATGGRGVDNDSEEFVRGYNAARSEMLLHLSNSLGFPNAAVAPGERFARMTGTTTFEIAESGAAGEQVVWAKRWGGRWRCGSITPLPEHWGNGPFVHVASYPAGVEVSTPWRHSHHNTAENAAKEIIDAYRKNNE